MILSGDERRRFEVNRSITIKVGILYAVIIVWDGDEQPAYEWSLCPDNDDKCDERSFASGKQNSLDNAVRAINMAANKIALDILSVVVL